MLGERQRHVVSKNHKKDFKQTKKCQFEMNIYVKQITHTHKKGKKPLIDLIMANTSEIHNYV